jgi:hypothetical protein
MDECQCLSAEEISLIANAKVACKASLYVQGGQERTSLSSIDPIHCYFLRQALALAELALPSNVNKKRDVLDEKEL